MYAYFMHNINNKRTHFLNYPVHVKFKRETRSMHCHPSLYDFNHKNISVTLSWSMKVYITRIITTSDYNKFLPLDIIKQRRSVQLSHLISYHQSCSYLRTLIINFG